jgi:hypothetical protein
MRIALKNQYFIKGVTHPKDYIILTHRMSPKLNYLYLPQQQQEMDIILTNHLDY